MVYKCISNYLFSLTETELLKYALNFPMCCTHFGKM